MAEKKVMTAITSIAPTKAAMRMARKPLTPTPAVAPLPRKSAPMKSPRAMLPPKASITMATASPAPLLIPNTSGPARGLRKAVCRSKPLVARAAPESKAAIAAGSRDSNRI